MDIAIIFLITAGIFILILIAVNALMFWSIKQSNQKIDELLEKGKIKDFKSIFLSQKKNNDDLEEKVRDIFLKIKNLEDTCETTIRKIGVVRFNPFNSMGGNQSFVIAMLNDKNDGFLISSLFTEENSRVYTKAIENGKSDHALSKEESEAIARAMSSGNSKL